LLKTLGAEVRAIAPRTLLPNYIHEIYGATPYTDIYAGLKDADVVMVLRLQEERMSGAYIPSIAEYFHLYGLDYKKLAYAKPSAFVMDPGPVKRGVGIDTVLADDIDRSVILDQVEMGVAVRQAILEAMS